MKTKRTFNIDLEGNKIIFREIGFIIVLTAILIAFEWKTTDIYIHNDNFDRAVEMIEEVIPITEHKPPAPPPIQKALRINIVNDDVKVEVDLIINVEATEETAIQEYIPISELVVMDEEIIEEEPIFIVVESAPGFPGGITELNRYLSENISYPRMAKEANIQGTVYVTFVISKTGEITDVRILRGIGGGCDEEAIRVVNNMPRWEPGKQRGMPVNVQFNLPVKFILY